MSLRLSRYISLRTRFMLLAVLLTVIFTSVWGSWVWQRERQQLHQQLEREGEMLVASMSIPIINALLYQELGIIEEGGLLDNFIGDMMANPQLHPLYALVTDPQGKVLAHNQLIEYGELLTDPLTRQALRAEGFKAVATRFNKQRILDLQMPLKIAGKRWGALRVGVSLKPLEQRLEQLELQIIGFGFSFAAGALLLFSLVGAGLVRPLMRLTREMEKVPEEEPHFLDPIPRKDEIGQLQESFTRLLARLKQSEKGRDESLQRLLQQERLVTAGKLAAGVAHEVNNPLAGIEGALFGLEKRVSPEAQEYLDLIRKEVERVSGLIGQLLDLSNAESLDFQPVDSQQLFEQFEALVKIALKRKVRSWQFKNLCQRQILCVDIDKLKQVVLNLALNAADAAGEEGGVILSVYDHQGDYCIMVGDNGPGVPPAQRESIFELFFTTKKPGKGTGIGLAMSRNIIEQHDGSLQLLLNQEPGAQFLARVPLNNHRCAHG